MNILYWLRSHPSASSFVSREIRALINQGHNIAVFSQANKGRLPDASVIDIENLESAYCPVSLQNLSYLFKNKYYSIKIAKKAAYDDVVKYSPITLTQYAKGAEFVSNLDMKIDHIHCHFATRSQ